MTMKKNTLITCSALLIGLSLIIGSCKKNNNNNNGPVVYYQQEDQAARPAINTVFNAEADKQTFNTTAPIDMSALFQAKFQARLLALNPGYTTNALGLDAPTFTSVLATDVLNVSTKGTTTFFNGTSVLTGRQLSDDVITVELTLIFGGPNALTGSPTNPGLITDNVPGNDKAFLTSFPYEAAPW
jgi:Domain of unknown function (DUF4331)